MHIVRKATAAPAEDDALDYVMSDATADRYGDVIEPDGWQLRHFKRNPIALFGHDSRFPIGTWRNVRVENGALRGHLELMEAVTDRLREIHAAVKAGVLRAVSVGFRPLASEPIGDTGMRFLKAELVECSLVSIGANPNALAVVKALNLSDDVSAMILAEPGERDRVVRRGINGEPADNSRIARAKPMTLAKKIEGVEQDIVALKDKVTELVGKDGEMGEDDRAALDELNSRLEARNETHAALKRAEASLAQRSEFVTTTALTQRVPAVAAKKIEPKDYVYRAMVVGLLAKLEQKSREEIRRARYGDDEATKLVMDVVTKAATVPATTTLTGWAAELVETSIQGFLDSLMPMSVYPRLSAIGGRFSFGRAGIVSIPARSATPTVAGSFVAQGSPIPVRQAGFAAITLTPKKMGVISTFTREIAEHSTPSIEQLIRQAIEEDTAIAIDSVLLDATAESTTRPAGIRNGVTVTSATAGGGMAALRGDVKALVGVLTAANSLRSPAWIMNPVNALSISLQENAGGDTPFAADIAAGRFTGYPLIQSTSVTAGMVILIEAADFFSATGDEPRFDVSDQAVLHMEDTTPLGLSVAGSPNVVAAPARSLWQTDTLGIRMILDINWKMRRTGTIAWTQAVTW